MTKMFEIGLSTSDRQLQIHRQQVFNDPTASCRYFVSVSRQVLSQVLSARCLTCTLFP